MPTLPGQLNNDSYAEELLYETFSAFKSTTDIKKELSYNVGIARACKCYQDVCPSPVTANLDPGKCPKIPCRQRAKYISGAVAEARTRHYEAHAPPYHWAVCGDFLCRTARESSFDVFLIFYQAFDGLRADCGELLRSLHNNKLREDFRVVGDEVLLEKCKKLSVQASSVTYTVVEDVVRGRENTLLTIAAAEGQMFRIMNHELLETWKRLAAFEIWICCMLRLMEARKVLMAVGDVHARMVCYAKLAKIYEEEPLMATAWGQSMSSQMQRAQDRLCELRTSCTVPLSQAIPIQDHWAIIGHQSDRNDNCITELEESGTCSHIDTKKGRAIQRNFALI